VIAIPSGRMPERKREREMSGPELGF
jgi:hypothetical protein